MNKSTKYIVIALLVILILAIGGFLLWATGTPKASVYKWEGPVFSEVSTITITEVNSTNPNCAECKSLHNLIKKELAGAEDKIAHRFVVLPKSDNSPDSNSSTQENFNENDLMAFCLSPEVGIASTASFKKFTDLAFEQPNSNLLDKIYQIPRQKNQIRDCVAQIQAGGVSYIEDYLDSIDTMGGSLSSFVVLQVPGYQSVPVQNTEENISTVISLIKSDLNTILKGLTKQPQ